MRGRTISHYGSPGPGLRASASESDVAFQAPAASNFRAHCNKRVRFNDEGPVRWYLGTQYDRDPITGAVSASQELYINKLLTRWHMLDCNPTKIPCSGKLDEILTSLQQVPATPNPALLKEYKELIGSLLFLQTGTIPEISWIVSVLA
jgi:hypothetical protein